MRQVAGRGLLVGVPLEGLWDRELRKRRLAQLELDFALFGYPQRVVACAGTSPKRRLISAALFR